MRHPLVTDSSSFQRPHYHTLGTPQLHELTTLHYMEAVRLFRGDVERPATDVQAEETRPPTEISSDGPDPVQPG